MEFLLIYIITILWNIDAVAGVLIFACSSIIGVVCFIVGLNAAVEHGQSEFKDRVGDVFKPMWSYAKWLVIPLAVVSMITPSKDQLYIIAGGGLALKAVQNEEVQELPSNVVSAINRFLETIEPEHVVDTAVKAIGEVK